MEAFLMEKATVKAIVGPVDLNDAANTGLRVDISKARRVSFICVLAAGTIPASHTFTLYQHTVATAGTPAVLAVDNPYFHKISTATEFTKVVPGAAASAYDLDTLFGDTKGIVVFEVLAEQLTDGYKWVSIDLTDSAGAQLGVVIAIAHDVKDSPAYGTAV